MSTICFIHAARTGSVASLVKFGLGCEGVLYSYVTAKRSNNIVLNKSTCMRGLLSLCNTHVSLLTLEDMLLFFLVFPASVCYCRDEWSPS